MHRNRSRLFILNVLFEFCFQVGPSYSPPESIFVSWKMLTHSHAVVARHTQFTPVSQAVHIFNTCRIGPIINLWCSTPVVFNFNELDWVVFNGIPHIYVCTHICLHTCIYTHTFALKCSTYLNVYVLSFKAAPPESRMKGADQTTSARRELWKKLTISAVALPSSFSHDCRCATAASRVWTGLSFFNNQRLLSEK